MFKKMKIMLLTALMITTSVLPVSAAESTAVNDKAVVETTVDEQTQAGNETGENNSSEEADFTLPGTDIPGSEGLVVDLEGDDGDTTLPDGDQLEQIEDVDMSGNITVTLTEGKEGTSVAGVAFVCEKVADIVGGEYSLLDAYKDSGVDLNSIQNAADMDAAALKLEEMLPENMEGFTTAQDGTLTFAGLEVGVYLVSAVDDSGFDEISPALIAIPTWNEEEGEMLYDVNVIPKHTARPDEPEEPASSSEGNNASSTGAPQTNVDSPVLIYFGVGLGLVIILIIGNVIYRKHRKK